MTIDLNSPETLANLRKEAESWTRTYAVEQATVPSDAWTWLNGRCHPGIVLALLDALHEARTAYLKVHQHDLQIACNEREALRVRVQEMEKELADARSAANGERGAA